MTGVCRFEVTPVGRACSRSSFAEGNFIFHPQRQLEQRISSKMIAFCEERDATKEKVAAQCNTITFV
jgi:hypothetical protein